jgi:hypothetical protein
LGTQIDLPGSQQQASSGQLALPQCGPSTGHASGGQPSASGAQTPQLGLQQWLPGGHWLAPHTSNGSPQSITGHSVAAIGTHTPQPGSQQYWSGSHNVGPHGTCPGLLHFCWVQVAP